MISLIKGKITLILKDKSNHIMLPTYLLFCFSLIKRINSQNNFIKKIIRMIIQNEFKENAQMVTNKFEILANTFKNKDFIFATINKIEKECTKILKQSDSEMIYIKALIFIEEPFDSFMSKIKQMCLILLNVNPNLLNDS